MNIFFSVIIMISLCGCFAVEESVLFVMIMYVCIFSLCEEKGGKGGREREGEVRGKGRYGKWQ